MGLFLFHDHGHSHKGESHSHDHSSDAERGYAHSHNGEAHSHSHSHSQSISHRPHLDDEGPIEDILPGNVVAKTISVQSSFKRGFAHGRTASGSSAAPSSPYARSKNPHDNRHHTRSGSRHRRFADPETSIHVLPAQNRQEIINAAEGSSTEDDDLLESPGSPTATENTPLITSSDSTSHGHGSSSAAKHNRSDSMSHATHNHAKPKDPKKSGGYSHDLNMQGVFLHVLGDALGNIGVILTALFIWKTDYSWRFYTDPAISLLITMIIFSSALPLCKSASKILLQAVPRGISLDEVKADIMSIKGVMSVHELHIWQLSDVKMIASLHIQIGFDPETEEDRADGGGKYKGKKYMRLAKAIRECLHEYGIHSSTIQPEYIPSAIDGGEEHSRANRGYGGVTFASGSGGGAGASRRGSGSGHSTAGDSEDACLLDCGEECGNGKCCGPMVVSEGHGHAH